MREGVVPPFCCPLESFYKRFFIGIIPLCSPMFRSIEVGRVFVESDNIQDLEDALRAAKEVARACAAQETKKCIYLFIGPR